MRYWGWGGLGNGARGKGTPGSGPVLLHPGVVTEVRHRRGWMVGILLFPLSLHRSLLLRHLLFDQLGGKVFLILFLLFSLSFPVLGLLLFFMARHYLVVGHGWRAALVHAGGVAEGVVQHWQVGVSKGSLVAEVVNQQTCFIVQWGWVVLLRGTGSD